MPRTLAIYATTTNFPENRQHSNGLLSSPPQSPLKPPACTTDPYLSSAHSSPSLHTSRPTSDSQPAMAEQPIRASTPGNPPRVVELIHLDLAYLWRQCWMCLSKTSVDQDVRARSHYAAAMVDDTISTLFFFAKRTSELYCN